MIQIANVLCPVDFSDFSRHAVDHAAAMARWYQARLTVLHVFTTVPVFDLPPISMQQGDRVRIERELAHITSHLPQDLRLERRVKEASDVSCAVLDEASSIHADLMVLGSHGRSGFERLLLGSVTERLLRKAGCPTMVVPRRAPDVPADAAPRYGRILCSVDFSDGSLSALEYALTIAEENDARLTVVNAIEVPPELLDHPASGDFNVEAVRAAAEAAALRRLRELIPPESRTYCSVETVVREGAAYREILKVAGEQRADLIVMGMQGRGAVDLMIFGSNTARVARAATCPVLIVHASARRRHEVVRAGAE